MTWVDLYSFGNTTVQIRKVEPSSKSAKDKKKKEQKKEEPILVEYEIIQPKPAPFILKTYNKIGKLKEYNLPRKAIMVV